MPPLKPTPAQRRSPDSCIERTSRAPGRHGQQTQPSRPATGNAPIPPEGERLNKYLARTGVCSRREADDWIGRGWVHINGKPVVMGQLLVGVSVFRGVRYTCRASIPPLNQGSSATSDCQ